MLNNIDAREKGMALLKALHGDGAAQALVKDMEGLCPEFVDMSIEWALGGITVRPGLDLVTRELVVVASCVTLGHPVTQLRAHTHAAFAAGATRQQIIETILQLTFYAGGAAVRNGLVAIRDILGSPSPVVHSAVEHEGSGATNDEDRRKD
ncbi:carboxymuconolactone decarboxylase [Rhizobium sp. Root1203]|uniref:carboxymuconolactone decarboxylase family protein n=1 Tax=Rhizobium sp. Root1203 TaxID=1736427 RepID=UPI00070C0DC3|nr:carboxymuconolactone decarboxylase family protein [Rhizobium sp. Root1203]KQV19699.1 carboxymuconolactone decarboxylase [Rhizobium sp. Root1203]